MSDSIDISNIDLYGFLGLQKFASEGEIKRAYRKLARKLHPDKNPGIPIENFQKLGKIYELLTNIKEKAEYDKSLRAKEKAEKRFKEMDAETQRLRTVFNEKEKEYMEKKMEDERKQREKEQLIQRMREEGRKRQREEDERKSMEEDRMKKPSMERENQGFNVRVSWSVKKKDSEPVYTEEDIRELFSRFGDILHMVKSKKKEGLYLINYATKSAAVASTAEIGRESRPLKVALMFNSDDFPSPLREQQPAPEATIEDILKKYGVDPEAPEGRKSPGVEDETDERTGLPTKFVYLNGTDAAFAFAAEFRLPAGIVLSGDEEVVHGGFLVKLHPHLRKTRRTNDDDDD